MRRTRAVRDLSQRVKRLETQLAALQSSARPVDGVDTTTALPEAESLAPIAALPEATSEFGAAVPAAVSDDPLGAATHDAPSERRREPAYLPPPAPTAAPAWASIDWERLFGVRAAALLGGIALALAGLLFFKYSIEHGLIPPWLRVVLGTIVGVGCIVGGELALRRRYAGTADALIGGGLVVLYAAFWAASVRYGLVPIPVGYFMMMAVTATGCVLAARHAALATAVIGLAGGFATPLLLSTGADRPIGLFGYVLLLDVALLYLARRCRWPALALLSLGGTVAYQALWIGTRMGPDRLGFGLVILGLFALLFAVAGSAASSEQPAWRWSTAASVLLPFAFALYFAADADFGPTLNPVAALLLLLCLAAGWVAREPGPNGIALGAAAASLGILATWVAVRDVDGGHAWQLALWTCAIASAFHAYVVGEPDDASMEGPAPAALLATGGGFALLLAASVEGGSLAPWLVGFGILAALLVLHASLASRAPLHVAAALGVGFGLAALRGSHFVEPWFPGPSTFLLLAIGVSALFAVVAQLRWDSEAQRWSAHAAALLPVMLLLYLTPRTDSERGLLSILPATLVLGLLAAYAATRLSAGGWLLAAMVMTALAHAQWTDLLVGDPTTTSHAGVALALQGFAVACFTAWPFLDVARWRSDRLAWPAAALAGPAWFLSLRSLFLLSFGDAAIGLLPIGLGALAVVAMQRARDLWPPDEAQRTETLAAFGAVALGFVTLAIPLQVSREWITIGWALEGVAVLALWRRLDHVALKYFAVALLGAAAVRLIANPSILAYYARPEWRVVNWLLYAYLLPAAAMLAGSSVLAALELPRARAWERTTLYARPQPWGALTTGVAGLAVIFVWINLTIADWFSRGSALEISFERLPARDLSASIAWAVYALVLLILGVARRSVGLRWASLVLLLVTIAKVFLHDLGELRDLYRVASLLGLAISLMVVSLAYQRFVFRDADAPASPSAPQA